MSTQDAPARGDGTGGFSPKVIVIVALMLVVEAGAIVLLMTTLGRPAAVNAVDLLDDPSAELERIVEIPVLHEKFNNARQGRVWIWDTEIIVQVKSLHAEAVAAEIEEKKALIRTGVSQIIAAAQHAYFNEPGRVTISRQIQEYLNKPEVIGPDAEGEPRVGAVLIPSCIGFPTDY
jgi:hypothetical protein